MWNSKLDSSLESKPDSLHLPNWNSVWNYKLDSSLESKLDSLLFPNWNPVWSYKLGKLIQVKGKVFFSLRGSGFSIFRSISVCQKTQSKMDKAQIVPKLTKLRQIIIVDRTQRKLEKKYVEE